MVILLVNDDGFNAHGLRALKRLIANLYPEAEVWVFAPKTDHSGQSHSVTFETKISIEEVSERQYKIGGSPVDCVLLGLKVLMQNSVPDVVISGINAGSNLGFDKLYSGTVGAAMEGRLQGIPSIAIAQAYMSTLKEFQSYTYEKRIELFISETQAFLEYNVENEVFKNMIKRIIDVSIKEKNHCYCTSINLPYTKDVKGIKVNAMTDSSLGFEFKRTSNNECIIGTLPPIKQFPDAYIRDGYITVCPIAPDWTDQKGLIDIRNLIDTEAR